jgi:Myb-like DNA-binding domain
MWKSAEDCRIQRKGKSTPTDARADTDSQNGHLNEKQSGHEQVSRIGPQGSHSRVQPRTEWNPLEDDVLFQAVATIHNGLQRTDTDEAPLQPATPPPDEVDDHVWDRISQFVMQGRTPLQCYKRYSKLRPSRTTSATNAPPHPSSTDSSATSRGTPDNCAGESVRNPFERIAQERRSDEQTSVPQSSEAKLGLAQQNLTPFFGAHQAFGSCIPLPATAPFSDFPEAYRLHQAGNSFNPSTPAATLTLPMHSTTGEQSWSREELDRLESIVSQYGNTFPRWDEISPEFNHRTAEDCMRTWRSLAYRRITKGKCTWTEKEDRILFEKHLAYGRKWTRIAAHLPGRHAKQCRERFVNHLDPQLRKGGWSEEEESLLVSLHARHGNKWAKISKMLPGRSDNDAKNHWNSTMQRRFQFQRGHVRDSNRAGRALSGTCSHPRPSCSTYFHIGSVQ